MRSRIRLDPARLEASPITAVDLFCGAGGLTQGLLRAGVSVEAGIDIDPDAEFAYTRNNAGARFLAWDLNHKYSPSVEKLFRKNKVRLLAGCAPCQPFSKLTNGIKRHRSWDLLDKFGRLISGIEPELVTMENVPELEERGAEVFLRFLERLDRANYKFDYKVVRCADYGVPQARQRLVLVASKLGPIQVPRGRYSRRLWKTVRDVIEDLTALGSGEHDPTDRLHTAARLSPTNLKRVRATPEDGGTHAAWPEKLRLACHKRETGARYGSIYGRMWWDKPAPTMTTLCNGIGNGRFGHPEQDRAITLREAALIQSFPPNYEFWPRDSALKIKAIARMVGNAVPPSLGRAIGSALLKHVRVHHARD
jgi:DNA (cytosine-5)-methyltransferase 1